MKQNGTDRVTPCFSRNNYLFIFCGFWVIFGRKTGASVRDGVDRSTPFSCILELFYFFYPRLFCYWGGSYSSFSKKGILIKTDNGVGQNVLITRGGSWFVFNGSLKFNGNYAEFLFCKIILSYGKLLFKAKFNEFLQGLIVFLNVP